MKEKWLDLSTGQKVIFCLQLVLIVLFVVLYSTVGQQQVLRRHGVALRLSETENAVIYSGTLNGHPLSYTVRDDSVEYRFDDHTLLYTVTEDPTAVPPAGTGHLHESMRGQLQGVEVHKNGELLFRGGWARFGSSLMLYNEDGSNSSASVFFVSGGIPNDPGAATILNLIHAPDVEKRSHPAGLFCGIFLCAACMVSLLFADELFRWNLRFRIRNAEDAEPSDWELGSRWICWLMLTGAAIFVFVLGLTGGM